MTGTNNTSAGRDTPRRRVIHVGGSTADVIDRDGGHEEESLPANRAASEFSSCRGGGGAAAAAAAAPASSSSSSSSLYDTYIAACTARGCHPNSSLSDLLSEIVMSPCLLTILDLSQNMVGPRGIEPVLMMCKEACCLTSLDLRENRLDNRCMKYVLQYLYQHPSLQRLDLRGNPISHGGTRWLFSWCRTVKSLLTIDLEGTLVSAATQARLHQEIVMSKTLQQKEEEEANARQQIQLLEEENKADDLACVACNPVEDEINTNNGTMEAKEESEEYLRRPGYGMEILNCLLLVGGGDGNDNRDEEDGNTVLYRELHCVLRAWKVMNQPHPPPPPPVAARRHRRRRHRVKHPKKKKEDSIPVFDPPPM